MSELANIDVCGGLWWLMEEDLRNGDNAKSQVSVFALNTPPQAPRFSGRKCDVENRSWQRTKPADETIDCFKFKATAFQPAGNGFV
jgi:hypothetical protein